MEYLECELYQILFALGPQMSYLINSLWPSDVIWHQGSCLALVQVIKACCLKAPSHCLNQLWLIITGVQWNSPKTSFTNRGQDINLSNEFEKYTSMFTATHPRVQRSMAPIPCLVIKMLCDTVTHLLASSYTAFIWTMFAIAEALCIFSKTGSRITVTMLSKGLVTMAILQG